MLKNKGCVAIVCSCRTYGGTFDPIKAMSGEFEICYIETKELPENERQKTLDEKVKYLIESLEEHILSIL